MPLPDMTPWQKVKARYEAGEFVPLHVRKMAEEALGEKFVRRQRLGRGTARPDYRDRQAGDDSFEDARAGGGMVAL